MLQTVIAVQHNWQIASRLVIKFELCTLFAFLTWDILIREVIHRVLSNLR